MKALSKKHYENAADAKLSDIFSAEDFRLVPAEFKKAPCGYSEIFAEVDIKQDFAQKLSFDVPWDGELYGYLRNKSKLYSKLGKDTAVKVTLSDWDDKFAVIFEDKNGKEDPVFYVDPNEVKELLEKCMKPEN